jgi:hypothetical protein
MATSGNTCLPGNLCLHTILSFWEVFAKQSREDAQSVDGAGQIVVIHDRGSEGLLVLNCVILMHELLCYCNASTMHVYCNRKGTENLV